MVSYLGVSHGEPSVHHDNTLKVSLSAQPGISAKQARDLDGEKTSELPLHKVPLSLKFRRKTEAQID